MFELVGLPNTWFSTADDESIEFLTRIINKSYDKPRFKFGVIGTPRVKHTRSFSLDFGISNTKPFVMYLFLAPAEKIREFTEESPRDFRVVSQNTDDAFDSDIPPQHVSNLSFNKDTDFKIKIVEDGYKITKKVLERVIGTIGFKDESGSDEEIKELELTSFTSFLRNSGPVSLEVVIAKVLQSATQFDELFNINRKKLKSIKIHGVVIKEHGLVKYYTSKCGFVEAPREDVFIEIDANGNLVGNELEDGITANKSFHLSFIYRVVELD